MARKRLSKSQVISIALLWVVLVIMMLVYSEKINFETIFVIVASGLIIFLGISKNT